MRHKKVKKTKKKEKSHFGPVILGCGASDGNCEGICAKLHREGCIALFKYRWEYNKKYKQGRQKVIVKDKNKERDNGTNHTK